MPTTVFDLAGYTPILFEYKPCNIFGSIDLIISENPEQHWCSPIFHEQPETPNHWVEYYPQSALNSELLTIDDSLCKNHQKEHHSWADEWDRDCQEEDNTEWCYWQDNKSFAKCSQWYILPVLPWSDFTIYWSLFPSQLSWDNVGILLSNQCSCDITGVTRNTGFHYIASG